MDLALNNLQWLICHKTKPNRSPILYYTNITKLRKNFSQNFRTLFTIKFRFQDKIENDKCLSDKIGIVSMKFPKSQSHPHFLDILRSRHKIFSNSFFSRTAEMWTQFISECLSVANYLEIFRSKSISSSRSFDT